ncbi:biotin/lipoyl-containing protein [Pseudarthrobacter sp. NBSH8]|uniref:biotin/lipoyl-containing protein n=1 Tax=Pseudarthrobacter sp. NBSH8 TaxID=2596911 RepID=UPI00351B732E
MILCRRSPAEDGVDIEVLGDRVERNRPLVEVETSKSAVELPSPQAGKVVRIFGGAGDRINVGEPLIAFEVPDNTAGIVGTVPKDEAPTRWVRLSAVLDED